jgi:hypothetical protein
MAALRSGSQSIALRDPDRKTVYKADRIVSGALCRARRALGFRDSFY